MPDLSKLRSKNGDFDQAQLEEAYCDEGLLDEIPKYWAKHAQGLRTIAFTVGVTASLRLCDRFRRVGVRAEHVDGTSSDADLESAIAKLRNQEIDVLCNCAVLLEGLDVPEAGAIILATSTFSVARYMQMCGRGLRIAAGKRRLVIIDHGGNAYRHDLVDAERDWHNHGKTLADSLKRCVSCAAMIPPWVDTCSSCWKPAQVGPSAPAALAVRRAEQASTKRTRARPCPVWAEGVAAAWLAAEQERVDLSLPLSYPDSRARRALRKET